MKRENTWILHSIILVYINNTKLFYEQDNYKIACREPCFAA